MSDSLQPHGLHHASLPCPSPTPGVDPNPHPSSHMDLTEAEDIKKRWQEYTEELYKKESAFSWHGIAKSRTRLSN